MTMTYSVNRTLWLSVRALSSSPLSLARIVRMDPRSLLVALLVSVVWVPCQAAPADANYPARPVRFIVQGAAGSGPDVLARVVVDHLAKRWERAIVVVNK